VSYEDAICERDFYGGDGFDYEPEPDDQPTGSEDQEDSDVQ
jgi:hypothetical protein